MDGEKGYTWDLFEENARDHEIHSRRTSSRNPLSPTSGRLCREDMAIYGEIPVSDTLSLVICRRCSRVIKSQALIKHKECYHSELRVHPVTPTFAPHSVGQPSQAHSTTSPTATPSMSLPGVSSGDGGEGGMMLEFTASSLPTISSNNKMAKEYDPNRHCGVMIKDTRKPCSHSLTCKIHQVSERRQVRGRSKTFDLLLEEHRKRRKNKKLNKLREEVGLTVLSGPGNTSPMSSPLHFSSSPPPPPSHDIGGGDIGNVASPQYGLGEHTTSHTPLSPQWDEASSYTSTDNHKPSFPKPLATCSLSCRRSLSGGSLIFDRRGDNLRTLLARLSGQNKGYATSIHRKHSYNSLLEEQNKRKRTYYSHMDHTSNLHPNLPDITTVSSTTSERPPALLPLPLHPHHHHPHHHHHHPLTPSQPNHDIKSPLTANTIITSISNGMVPPSLSDPYNTATSLNRNSELTEMDTYEYSTIATTTTTATAATTTTATSISNNITRVAPDHAPPAPASLPHSSAVNSTTFYPPSSSSSRCDDTQQFLVSPRVRQNLSRSFESQNSSVGRNVETGSLSSAYQPTWAGGGSPSDSFDLNGVHVPGKERGGEGLDDLSDYGRIRGRNGAPYTTNTSLGNLPNHVSNPTVSGSNLVSNLPVSVGNFPSNLDDGGVDPVKAGTKRSSISRKKSKAKRSKGGKRLKNSSISITEELDGPISPVQPVLPASYLAAGGGGGGSPVRERRGNRFNANPGSHSIPTSDVSPLQSGNGTAAAAVASHSENPLPTPVYRGHRGTPVSEPIRTESHSMEATPTSVEEPSRTIVDYRNIRVKKEPGLNHEYREKTPPPTARTVPNGLIPMVAASTSSQSLSSTSPHLHSFNSIHSPQTFVLNPSGPSPHHARPPAHPRPPPVLPSLSPHMSNLFSITSPYSNQQQQQYLAAAAVVAQQSPTYPIQQLANFQQLIEQRTAMYKQAVNQAIATKKSFQDLKERLIQQQQSSASQQSAAMQLSGRNLPAASISKTVPGMGGGVVNYQQVGGALHGLQQQQQQQQVATGKQGGVTPINAHHRLPTLTSNKIRAPISHVPSGMAYRPDGPRSMPTLTPGGLSRTPNSLPPALGQSSFLPHHHQNKSTPGKTGNDRPHLPSQQVT